MKTLLWTMESMLPNECNSFNSKSKEKKTNDKWAWAPAGWWARVGARQVPSLFAMFFPLKDHVGALLQIWGPLLGLLPPYKNFYGHPYQ